MGREIPILMESFVFMRPHNQCHKVYIQFAHERGDVSTARQFDDPVDQLCLGSTMECVESGVYSSKVACGRAVMERFTDEREVCKRLLVAGD